MLLPSNHRVVQEAVSGKRAGGRRVGGEGHENTHAKSTAEESGKEKQSGEKVISARADAHGEDNRGVLAGQAKKFLPNC